MKIEINRNGSIETFEIPNENRTLLQALYEIKNNQDNTLTFSSNCRSGVCGTCAVRVNGREELACSYKVQDGDFIEPLQ
ncbi:MAG TPA: 2Fe-2S iron-sulfur cluster binding domain-containing protein, partial [Campylobacterales bacterium]|nr:2Fe-2S iron-sulfur cluster binding domain-containing protein [Campylobacterales bacterium]